MRIFLDTNVLASAFATRGLCADLFQAVLAEHELLVGIHVLDELQDVLSRKFQMPSSIIKEYLSLLRREGDVITAAHPSQAKLRDTDDEKILANALAGKADVFVTGDQELLALARVKGMPVVSPRGLWSLLQQQP